MSSESTGQYAPQWKAGRVCEPGDFRFAALGLDHGHIYGMCKGLEDAGGECVAVLDPDPRKQEEFQSRFPRATAVRSKQEVLQSDVQLVACAAVPADRAPLGVEVLEHGKHFFSDKPPLTTAAQHRSARDAAARTGRHWFVFYSERLHNEAAVHADSLIRSDAIGRVIQVVGLGPHRLDAPNRPDWFFRRDRYGGILVDIGSHQIEQFLHYAGASDAEVSHSLVGNFGHPQYPELEDYGEAGLIADTGATCYFRVDWFTPDGLRTWGDGRTFILGTEGYIELRKYIDVAREDTGDHVYLVNGEGERHIPVHGKVGYPYFGQLIRDVLDGTGEAMPQAHTFRVAELCLSAQESAMRIDAGSGGG